MAAQRTVLLAGLPREFSAPLVRILEGPHVRVLATNGPIFAADILVADQAEGRHPVMCGSTGGQMLRNCAAACDHLVVIGGGHRVPSDLAHKVTVLRADADATQIAATVLELLSELQPWYALIA